MRELRTHSCRGGGHLRLAQGGCVHSSDLECGGELLSDRLKERRRTGKATADDDAGVGHDAGWGREMGKKGKVVVDLYSGRTGYEV